MSIRYARRIRLPGGLIAALILLALVAGSAAAQAHTTAVAPDSIRKIQHLEPRSGPPGTVVSIHTENLALQARVVLGAGAIGTGFEELGEAQQQEMGEVTASVRVPDSATWDRPLVFIIFNGNFSPTGLSDPFHVTNQEGLIQRTGVIAETAGGCPGFRDKDGYEYTLMGNVSALEPGDEVVIEGRFFALSDCDAGETISVVRHAPVEPTDGR